MSAQSIAKAAQGYEPKPVSDTCSRCAHFAATRELPEWEARRNRENVAAGFAERYSIEDYGRDVKLRCTLGGFAVKKMGTCREFVSKVLP